MQAKIVAVLALLQVASANPLMARAPPSCNANNCYRQVAATSHAPFPASARADCSKNLVSTVTPCPTTVTVAGSSTVTTTVTGIAPANKRDVKIEARLVTVCQATTASPSPIPTYASSCANFAAYSSACSCNGVTASTASLPPSTVTVTATPTATQTVVPVYQIVSPSDSTELGFRDPNDSSLVIGKLRAAGYFFIDEAGFLREYQSDEYIVARDDSKNSGPGVYQYFIGDPESGIIPQATVTGDQLALKVPVGTNTDQFCYRNDNGVLAYPEAKTCRFENSYLYVNWVPAYAPYRGF